MDIDIDFVTNESKDTNEGLHAEKWYQGRDK